MTDPGRELTDHELSLLKSYVDCAETIATLNEIKMKSRDQLAASLGDLKGYVGEKLVVSISRSTPRRFDVTTFKKDHALLYAQYQKDSVHPVVTLHPNVAALAGL